MMREHQHVIVRTFAAAVSLMAMIGATPGQAAESISVRDASSQAQGFALGTPVSSGQALPDGAVVDLYDEAFRLLRNGETAAAGETFAVVIALFPDDPLATNAHYWLGEIYSEHRRYSEAARHFATAYERSARPGGSMAGDALLKLSAAQRRAGEAAKACVTLDRLASEQPVEAWRLSAGVATERRDAGCSASIPASYPQASASKANAGYGSSRPAPSAARPMSSGASDDRLTGALQNLPYPQGQYLLGLIYEEGKRVERSLDKAREHYRRAAGSGSAAAQNALARLQAAN